MKQEAGLIIEQKLRELNGFLVAGNYSYSVSGGYDPQFFRDASISYSTLLRKLKVSEQDEVEEVFAHRVEVMLLQIIKAYLTENPQRNWDFFEKTDWKVLNQILTVSRLKELSKVKIIKRAGRGKGGYDMTELAETFFGAKIFQSHGLSTRRILKSDELEKVKEDCARLKLELPEIVEPTTTEKFFS